MSNWDRLVAAVRTFEIKAPALRPAMLAQCILESGRGTSQLSVEHNNFTGLKWRPEMEGFATKISYRAHDGIDDYCAFATPEAFVPGYWRFISRSVYAGWDAQANDPAGYIAFLKSRGYAGDPNYIEKVVLLLAEARRLLAAGDAAPASTAAPAPAPKPTPKPVPAPAKPTPPPPTPPPPEAIEEPDRPSAGELAHDLPDITTAVAEPDFVSIPSIIHRWIGTRPKGVEGAIVHFDAGRTRPSKGADDPEFGARLALSGAVTNGFAYATISRTGRIYLPGNMDWRKWGYHAGASLCPATGRSGVSQYYVGFEVNSPGYVYATADPDVFVPWFEAVRDTKGNVVLDAKGRATVKNPNGELYGKAEVRVFPAKKGNIKAGAYVPYTKQQMEALVRVMLWLRRHYPASFRLDYIFGHDEVAPTRKLDPGGCLGAAGDDGLTMAEFRTMLQKAWQKQLDAG